MSKGRIPIPPESHNDDGSPFETDFDPVRTRARHDGWTPDKQVAFIEALAASGCVDHAARAVGMHVASAYRLRAHADAQSFSAAWDFALEHAITRLADAAMSRAIHGVSRPVFYKGEQIGERLYYNDRLAMFLLRTRDPARFGKWIDHVETVERRPEAAVLGLNRAIHTLAEHAWADELGAARPSTPVIFPKARTATDARDVGSANRDAEIAQLKANNARLQSSMCEALARAAEVERELAIARGERE